MLSAHRAGRKLRQCLLWWGAAVVLVVVYPANAATYQVGPARTYTNLQAIAPSLRPGDVVQVDGNATYPGNTTFYNSGTATQPITLLGIPVNGQRPVISGVNGLSGGAVFSLRADYYVVEGFDITGGGDTNTARGFYNTGNSNLLQDSVVHDCTNGTGISGETNSGSLTLHNVEVYHCGAGTNAHQIYVESDDLNHSNAVFRMEFCFVHDGTGGNNVKSRVARNEIYYNWIEGSPYYELDLIGADPSHQALGTNDAVREDSDVVGNVFYKMASAQGSLARLGSDGIGSSNGRYRFVNNTVVFDPGWAISNGIFKVTGVTNPQTYQSIEMYNNVFYRNSGYGDLQVDTNNFPNVFGANNWVPTISMIPASWTNTFCTNDPPFVNAVGFDFTPSLTSLLCDNAQLPTPTNSLTIPNPLQVVTNLPPVRTVYPPGLVLARSSANDIGAFELTSQQVNAGSNVTFTVNAVGTGPFNYQWRLNGTNLPGATATSLTLTSVQTANVGPYSVVVGNTNGTVVSGNFTLSLNLPPSITQQPVGVTINSGLYTSFTVSAAGTSPLSYQWRFNGSDIPGATAEMYVLSPALTNNAGNYSVVVTDVAGSVTSSIVILTVTPDISPPSLAITSPAPNVLATNPWLTVQGLAADDIGVAQVVYQFGNASFQPAIGTTKWFIPLTLTPGTNTVRVKSVDLSGNESPVVSRNFFYLATSALTVFTNGAGAVSPNLNGTQLQIGKNYSVVARPGANQVFMSWSGGVSSTNATLVFMMQSNLVLQANFNPDPFLPRKGTYTGLFSETDGVSHDSAGYFSLVLKTHGSVSGTILLDGNSLPMSGKFGVDGTASIPVSRAKVGKPPLLVYLDLGLSDPIPDTNRIRGSVSSADWSSTLLVNRPVWTVQNPATAFTNKYTIVLPHSENAGDPGGDGYGLVTVNALGKVSLTGATGDGATLSRSATISKNGDWPLYVPLYMGPLYITNGATVTTNKEYKGSLQGWVTLSSGAPAGSLTWIKTSAATNALYPAGITNEFDLLGSPYSAPPASARALALTNGIVILMGGNLPDNFTNQFVLTTNNKLTMTTSNYSFKLNLNATSGKLSGTFLHPANPLKSTKVYGVILQNAIIGRGQFPGTNQTGSIFLQPLE